MIKFLTAFDGAWNWALYAGLAMLIASAFTLFFLKKRSITLILIATGGMLTFLFAATLDPFLNTWDEQYHALVARNLSLRPLVPTLIDNPIVPVNPADWSANNIWLHKQPVFLWQMAASIFFLGENHLAVRLPSVILLSLISLFIYRIGTILVNIRTGIIAALLFATAYFPHELATGFPPSDHNDIAFLFYVTASIWCWFEGQERQSRRWLWLSGLFSGLAVLNKWLTGLLVFAGWGLVLLFSGKMAKFQRWVNIGIAALICALTFLPWQLYISSAFPQESAAEYALNTKHFFSVVENHGGGLDYYFQNIRQVYFNNDFAQLIILLSLVILYRNIRTRDYKIFTFTCILFVYLFFTIAATKMIAFCFIVSPFIFIALATALERLFAFIEKKLKTIYASAACAVILLLVIWGNLDLRKIAYKHSSVYTSNDNDRREEKIRDAVFVKGLALRFPDSSIVFNCKKSMNIPLMFYNRNITAFDRPLTISDYKIIKAKKYKLAVFYDQTIDSLLKHDKSILLLTPPDSTWSNY